MKEEELACLGVGLTKGKDDIILQGGVSCEYDGSQQRLVEWRGPNMVAFRGKIKQSFDLF